MFRRSLVICFTLLLALSISAITSAEPIKLQFAMWIDGASPGEIVAQQALVASYSEINPNVEVELYYQGWGGYHDKLLTMAAGGLTPDIVALSRLHVPNFVEHGVIQPIDPWFSQEPEEFKANIFEVVSGTYKNQLYGIPIWGGPIVAEYNADLFDLAGLPQPMDLARHNEWTWDAFIDMGKKITRDRTGDGINDVFMHARLGTRAADWYIKMRSYGADIITPDGQPLTDIGAIENALDVWSSFAHEHHIAPVGSETSSFVAGTEAVYFTWISDVPNHYSRATPNFRMELTTPPTGPAGQFTLVGGVPLTISATTEHPKEAYEFARWYAMESGHWQLRGMPSNLEELATDYRSYLATMVSWPEAVMHAMSGTYSMEPGVGMHFNELNQAWNESLSAVANGTMAPREGAIRMVQSTQRIVGY